MKQSPIGFVVEGTAEYQMFPQLVRCGIAASDLRIPILNCHGSGTLRARLEEKLSDLVRVHDPVSVIVSLDLREVLREGAYKSCTQLRTDLQRRCDDWLNYVTCRSAFPTLPQQITVVIQVVQLETWLLSGVSSVVDRRSLDALGLSTIDDVDKLPNPRKVLEQVLGGYDKRPQEVVALARRMHPHVMIQKSRSFRKLWKEVVHSFDLWSAATGGYFGQNASP